MDEIENPEIESLGQAEESDVPASPGEVLKLVRKELGFSKVKVADSLYMTVRYVTALEEDQYHILPGKTFIKGYLKSYAAFLNADVNEVLERYQHFTAALEQSEKKEAKVIQAKKNYDQNKRWLLCAAIIIVIVVGVSWWFK